MSKNIEECDASIARMATFEELCSSLQKQFQKKQPLDVGKKQWEITNMNKDVYIESGLQRYTHGGYVRLELDDGMIGLMMRIVPSRPIVFIDFWGDTTRLQDIVLSEDDSDNFMSGNRVLSFRYACATSKYKDEERSLLIRDSLWELYYPTEDMVLLLAYFASCLMTTLSLVPSVPFQWESLAAYAAKQQELVQTVRSLRERMKPDWLRLADESSWTNVFVFGE